MQIVKSFFKLEFLKYYLLIFFGTALIVLSRFDWWYLKLVYNFFPQYLLFGFDIFGFLFPIILLATLFFKNRKLFKKYFVLIITAFLSAEFIKVFTGRVSPPFQGNSADWIDNSLNFKFGFLREQIFGGFPSSHSTVFFAIAFFTYFLMGKEKNKKIIWILGFVIALSVGLAETLGFHWFSEFFAGSILGFVVAKIISENDKL